MMQALTASEGAARIRAGSLSSESLVSACLERIAAREHEVGAWQYLDADRAIAAARAADRQPVRGALHGVPIGVKDIIDTFDMPTGLGFAPYAERQPVWDAACVAACRRAGAIVLGKTVTTEFAYFSPGKTRNPHALDATPGGSSSGSAAAVADGMVPVAFGSQTAGSVIRPAAFCGVVGYKSSRGAFSLSGIRPFAESFDSLGVFGRSVDDIALVRRVLLDANDAPPLRIAAPRLGICRTPQWNDLEPDAREAFERAVEALARSGARIDPVVVPASFEPLIAAHRTIMAVEAAHGYVFELEHHRDALSAAFRELCETGRAVTRDALVAARRQTAEAMDGVKGCFDGYHAWVAPAALGEAPLAASGTGDPVMSRMWTALQMPCLALPAGRGPRGLPVGVQLVAPAGNDDALLAVGAYVALHLPAH